MSDAADWRKACYNPLVRSWVLGVVALVACAGGGDAAPVEAEATEEAPQGEPVEPPFQVAGDADGLVLTYYDEEGPHTVFNRDDVPEASRARVRVDSLELPPEQREPNHVYVADLRNEVQGRYAVRRYTRDTFDELLDEAAGVEVPPVVAAAPTTPANPANVHADGSDVIIYGASWCGACRSAARYLSQRGVPFEEKDIEREPGARAEMNAKARAAGIRPSGIPVIDFRGNILTGFDQRRIDRLIAQTTNSGTTTL